MALGFGFNKQKSQASAEKFVQQGKLQNAIAEYEKIVQEDPKDLGAVNTIGDLYVRLGQNDKAAQCFKRIGESYTSDGYTLKAIAMYKKLAKLAPDDRDAALKLAELFTQQGLYTEARSQYMHLAEQFLRSQDLNQATRIFQKMLEIDPDNTSIQTKLAELLMKIGKQDEAKEIYSRTAGVLRARGENAAAKIVLDKLLQIDSSNPDALLLKGMIAVESGDYRVAIPLLERVPNLDSISEALHALLRAYLHTGNLEKAEPLAQVLLSVHKDISGLSLYAQALLETGDSMHALELYDNHAAEFIAQDSESLMHALQGAIARIKDSSQGLELLRSIYRKTGESTYNNEVLELLAHAYVQEGKLDRAAQLYQELAAAEPENPLHTQNYKQILTRLGSDPIYRAPAQEESNQAFMIEELEDMARALPQQHPPELEERIQAALTESELFSSYNLPEKAITPLEGALAVAPYDIQLNQRLASLYTRMKRFDRAADRCEILAQVYGAAGHAEEAAQYEEFVRRYRGSSAVSQPPQRYEQAVHEAEPASQGFEEMSEQAWQAPVTPIMAEPEPPRAPVARQPVTAVPPIAPQEGSVKEFEFEVVQDAPEIHVEPSHAAPVAPSSTHEIDLSNEWEDMMTTDAPPVTPAATAPVLEMKPPQARSRQPETFRQPEAFEETSSSVVEKRPPEFEAFNVEAELAQPEAQGFDFVTEEPEPVEAAPQVDVVADLVEEINFYLSQSMLTESKAAIGKLAAEYPDAPQLAALQSKLAALEAAAKPKPVKVEVPKAPAAPSIPAPARAATPAKPTVVKISEAKAPAAAAKTPEVKIAETKPEVAAKAPAAVAPVVTAPVAAAPVAPPVVSKPVAPPVVKATPPTRPPKSDDDFLELSFEGESVEAAPPKQEKQAPLIEIPIPAKTTPARASKVAETDDSANLLEDIDLPVTAQHTPASSDILGSMANDLSASLEGDFLLETPPLSTTQQASQKISTAARGKETNGKSSVAASNPAQKAADSAQKAAELAAMKPAAVKKAPATDSAAMLAELFDEFKEDVEQQTAEDADLDTHYNLGAAFREMGLLDEAIGELQKVCNAIEKGVPFDQVIQAYTWLAQCLVERNLPKAAIPWYERALRIPDIGADSLIAIYYDLGNAHELAGNKKAAADSYTEACSMNIDYRDVVDRLKALTEQSKSS